MNTATGSTALILENTALRARVAELEAARCNCDEDSGHSPDCVVMVRAVNAAMVERVADLERTVEALRQDAERRRALLVDVWALVKDEARSRSPGAAMQERGR